MRRELKVDIIKEVEVGSDMNLMRRELKESKSLREQYKVRRNLMRRELKDAFVEEALAKL